MWQFKVNYKPKAQIEAKLREKCKSYFPGKLVVSGFLAQLKSPDRPR